MAKFKVGDGIAKYIDSLEALSEATTDTIGEAIFAGAAIVTDRIRSELESVPIESRRIKAGSGDMLTGLSKSQKEGLLSSLGIAHMTVSDGVYNVKVGVDGYNSTRTKTWPNGQPNALIARSMESGTSFRAKNPVFSRATRAARDEAEKAMAEAFDEAIEKRINF
mgnify:CR=1 FL=1